MMTVTEPVRPVAVPGHGVLVDETPDTFRVHRSTMTSPQLYARELRQVFARCWLYVGHESEVAQPGDYVRRPVGGRALFMVRSRTTGEINVFHNTCTHRGAVVCRRDSGSAKVFQCFYHAWSFDTDGRLVGVPDREAYGGGLDFGALGLRPVARLANYRGFVFASYDPGIVELEEYLGGAREYLDLVVDAMGQPEIVRGSNQYAIDANWKLLVENSVDGYHGLPTHDTYFKYLVSLGTNLAGGVTGFSTDLGNGHAVIEYRVPWGRPVAKWEPIFGPEAREEIERLRAGLVEKFGPERGLRMAETNRNLLIYPNLVVNDVMAVTVRTFMPSAADQMRISAWELAPRDELPQLRHRRLDNFLTFLGPGGFATPDDIEALESCQQGFNAGGVEWNDMSRGMNRRPVADDELQMRAFWRRWNEQMAGE